MSTALRYVDYANEFVTSGRLLVQFSFIETTGRRTARLCWTVPERHSKSERITEQTWVDIVSVVRYDDMDRQLFRWLREPRR